MLDGNMYFPSQSSVLFCDPLLGPAALVAPLRWLSANPILLYNVAVLAVLAVASFGFYLVARHMTGNLGVALLAGIVIPYSPQQTQHLVHLNLLTLAGFPFLLLGLFRLVDKPGIVAAAAVALAFTFQAGTSGYHAFTAAILCLIFAVWRWREFARPTVTMTAMVAAMVAAILLSPYITRFVRLKATEEMTRGAEAASHYSVDLVDDTLKSRSRLWTSSGVLRPGARAVFPGVTVVVLGSIALFTRSRYRWFLAAIAAVFFVLALGPQLKIHAQVVGSLPLSLLIRAVPLFDAIRHPVTFAVPATMGAGLLAAMGAQRLRLGERPMLLAVVLAFAVAETWSGWPPRMAPAPLPVAYALLQSHPPGALLNLPLDDTSKYQWWATLHGMPMVNGAGAFEPRRYADLHRLLRREWSDPAMGNLQGRRSTSLLQNRFPISYVVLHAWADPALRSNIAATPELFHLLAETGEGDRVYRFGTTPD